MTTYVLTGIENCVFSPDRSRLDLRFRTNKGNVVMKMKATHLDHLITLLQALLRPAQGALPGEKRLVRPEIVDHHQIGKGEVNGVPSVLLGLKGKVLRWYALDAQKAAAIQRALENTIPKLQTGSHQSH